YMKVADTLGLGVFAGAGVAVALSAGLSIFHTILFAIITAVGGGMLRDILLNEIPFVLKKEVYATAAGIGGLASYIIFMLGYGAVGASIVAVIVTILVRWYAMSKGMHLPRIG
ncbi:trimeric intracellular cation channel family protein, partial [archaeon]